MLRAVVCLVLSAFGSEALAASGQVLRSPDGRIEVRVGTTGRLRYSVLLAGKLLVDNATLSLDVDHAVLGLEPKVRSARTQRIDRVIEVPVPRKAARIPERYQELRLELDGRYAVVFRAYDEGVAYRFETSLPQPEVKVYAEEAGFNFSGDNRVYYPQEEGFFSHNERKYAFGPLKDVADWRPRHPARGGGDRRRDQDRSRGVRRRRLPGSLAQGHGRQRARRRLPPGTPRGEAGERPRHQGRPHRRLHRGHPRHTRLPLAHPWHRGEGRRPPDELARLSPGPRLRRSRTRRGSGRARWPGTGGTPGTCTGWTSSPA